MRPCFWTSFFVDYTPEEAIDFFSKKEWFELELSDEHGRALLDRGDPVETGRAFLNYANDKGVTFPQGHLWLRCDIAAPNHKEVVDQLKQWLDLFLALEIEAAVIHPGGRTMRKEGYSESAVLAQQVKTLNSLASHIHGSGLRLCLENCSRDIDELLTIIEAVGSTHMGICLDTGHLNKIDGDQGTFIHRAGSLLKALHIADNDGSSDQHLLPYGMGTVPWNEVIGALKEIQYPYALNLEVPGERRCPLPIRLTKLDFAKRLLEFMLSDS